MERYLIIPSAIVALMIFAYMRNRQADRQDERRQRLEEKQEALMEMLKKNNPQQDNTITDEN